MPFRPLIALLEKHNSYSNWEAVVESSSTDDESALQHDEVKESADYAEFSANYPSTLLFGFFMSIYGKRGIFDGWQGYVFARLHAQYEFLSLAKAKAILRSRKETG